MHIKKILVHKRTILIGHDFIERTIRMHTLLKNFLETQKYPNLNIYQKRLL
jgi:hypothetical protein